jgi:hypothetical protein
VGAGAGLDVWRRDRSLSAVEILTPDLSAHGLVTLPIVMSHVDCKII